MATTSPRPLPQTAASARDLQAAGVLKQSADRSTILDAQNRPLVIISPDDPDDGDGAPDGTVYVQVAA